MIQIAPGERVRLVGDVVPTAGVLRAPASRELCVAFTVSLHVATAGELMQNAGEAIERSQGLDFRLRTDEGEIDVLIAGAELRLGTVWAEGDERTKAWSRILPLFPKVRARRGKFRERLLRARDTVLVDATARADASGYRERSVVLTKPMVIWSPPR